jgi:hypothetical protein
VLRDDQGRQEKMDGAVDPSGWWVGGVVRAGNVTRCEGTSVLS